MKLIYTINSYEGEPGPNVIIHVNISEISALIKFLEETEINGARWLQPKTSCLNMEGIDLLVLAPAMGDKDFIQLADRTLICALSRFTIDDAKAKIKKLRANSFNYIDLLQEERFICVGVVIKAYDEEIES